MARSPCTILRVLLVLLFPLYRVECRAQPTDPEDLALYMAYHCDEHGHQQGIPHCICHLLGDSLETKSLVQSSGPASCIDGMAEGTIDRLLYPCSNVDLLSFVSLPDLNKAYGPFDTKASDMWGWESNGREFALVGMHDGTAFVEVTTPESPIYRGKLPNRSTRPTWWTIIASYRSTAYIVAEENAQGLQIFDLRKLLTTETNVTFKTTDSTRGLIGSAHNIFVNEETGYLYVTGSKQCRGGLYMMDLSDQLNPVYAGCFDGDGYVHATQCVIYKGLDTRSNEDTLTIVDVTDKANPVMISRTSYANYGYTHQGWLTEDQDFFFFGDENDELIYRFPTRTYIVKLQDLQNITFEVPYSASINAIDHNLFYQKGYLYQANYRGGMRILRFERLPTPTLREIAYFDIYPSSDDSAFNGAWAVYPFLPSGSLLINGIEQGLFVVRWNGQENSNPNIPSSRPSSNPSVRPSAMPTPETCPLTNIPIIGIFFWLICLIFGW